MHIFSKYYFFSFLILITFVIFTQIENNYNSKLLASLFLSCELMKYFFINNYYLNKNILPVLNKTRDKDIANLIFLIFIIFCIILEVVSILISFFFEENKVFFFYLFPLIVLTSLTLFFLNFYFRKLFYILFVFYYIFFSTVLILDLFNQNIIYYIKFILLLNCFSFILNLIILINKIKFQLNFLFLKDFRTIFFIKKFTKHIFEKEFLIITNFLIFSFLFLYLFKLY